MDIQAQDNTTWLLRHYNTGSMNRKNVPYFAVNLMLAKSMGWVVEKSSNVYEVGPNLLVERPYGKTLSNLIQRHVSRQNVLVRNPFMW